MAWVVAASPASFMSSIMRRRSSDDMWFSLKFSPGLHDPTSTQRYRNASVPYPRAPPRRSRRSNRSLRTGLALISPDAANANTPIARSIRAAEAALNTWYDKENLVA